MAKTVDIQDVKQPRRLLYRGMSHLDADAKCRCDGKVLPLAVDGLLGTIFAPSRKTGMPGNALSVNIGESYDPATKEYIRQKLLGVNPNPVIGHDDPDVAMSMAKIGDETIDEYASRLGRVIESYYNSKEN